MLTFLLHVTLCVTLSKRRNPLRTLPCYTCYTCYASKSPVWGEGNIRRPRLLHPSKIYGYPHLNSNYFKVLQTTSKYFKVLAPSAVHLLPSSIFCLQSPITSGNILVAGLGSQTPQFFRAILTPPTYTQPLAFGLGISPRLPIAPHSSW